MVISDVPSEVSDHKLQVLLQACLVLADFSLSSVTAMVHFLYSGELISDR